MQDQQKTGADADQNTQSSVAAESTSADTTVQEQVGVASPPPASPPDATAQSESSAAQAPKQTESINSVPPTPVENTPQSTEDVALPAEPPGAVVPESSVDTSGGATATAEPAPDVAAIPTPAEPPAEPVSPAGDAANMSQAQPSDGEKSTEPNTENEGQATVEVSAPEAKTKKSNTFALVVIVVLLALVLFALVIYYFFIYQTKVSNVGAPSVRQPTIERPSDTQQLSLPETPSSPIEDAESTMPEISESDTIEDIESDLDSTEISDIDQEFTDVDSELEEL